MSYIDRPASFAQRPGFRALGNEPKGLGIDFCAMDMVVSDPDTPANNFAGNPNSKLTYASPSAKLICNRHGVLESGTTLRCDHDPATLGTSTTAIWSAPGSKSIAVTGGSYAVGDIVRATDAADISRWVLGRVTGWTGGVLTFDLYASSGVIAGSNWIVIVALGVLIEGQRTNLFTQSNFASGWSLFGNTMPISAMLAPDGSFSRKLTESLDGAPSFQHQIQQAGKSVAAGSPYVFSVYARAGERTRITVVGTASAVFDLSLGGVVSGPGIITPAGGGWYRCSVAAHAPSTTINPYIRMMSGAGETYTGDGASGVYLWGAQLEAGLFPSSYIPTTASQVTRATDSITLARSAIPYDDTQVSILIEARWDYGSGILPAARYALNIGSTTNRIGIFNRANRAGGWQVTRDSADQAGYGADFPVSTGFVCGAYRIHADDFRAACAGVLLAAGTSGAMPTPPSNVWFGHVNGGSNLYGHIRRTAIVPRLWSDAELQARTA